MRPSRLYWEQGTTSLVATVISIIVGIISLVLTYKWRRDWVVNGARSAGTAKNGEESEGR